MGSSISVGNSTASIYMLDPEGGDVSRRVYSFGIDSLAEPITFSVSANGELGLAGGMTVPFEFSLNHPGAYSYTAQAIIGAGPTALTADFSTLKEDVVLSTGIPFTPADAAYAPSEVNVAFTYTALFTGSDLDEDTGDKVYGSLTVNGTEVAVLKKPEGLKKKWLEDDQTHLVLEFVDGTYPASGGLFATVENIIKAECPEIELEEGESSPSARDCAEDQSGVLVTTELSAVFFAGFPTDDREQPPRP
jgi:hypothetical protein